MNLLSNGKRILQSLIFKNLSIKLLAAFITVIIFYLRP